MPILKPKQNETEKEFISRCVSDDTMTKEYPDQDQLIAVCYNQWRESIKENSESDENDLCSDLDLFTAKDKSARSTDFFKRVHDER